MLGAAVDLVKARGLGGTEFWPVGVLGLVLAVGFWLSAPRGGVERSRKSEIGNRK